MHYERRGMRLLAANRCPSGRVQCIKIASREDACPHFFFFLAMSHTTVSRDKKTIDRSHSGFPLVVNCHRARHPHTQRNTVKRPCARAQVESILTRKVSSGLWRENDVWSLRCGSFLFLSHFELKFEQTWLPSLLLRTLL
jgi:hypothetical protein